MFLTEHNIPFVIKDIKMDPKARQELTHKYQSYSTPTIIIDDQDIIRGFDLEILSEKLNISR
jgi:glutaredoxin